MSDNIKNLSKVSNDLVFERNLTIRSLFNRPLKNEGFTFKEPTMTQQQFAEECDLNNIVDHNFRLKDPSFITKLQLSSGAVKQEPIYGDFTEVSDYQSALDIVNNARMQFETLPSTVRDRFSNNPQKLLEFCNDPNNYDEGVKLGLFNPKPTIVLDNPEHLQQQPAVNAGQQTVSAPLSETSAQGLT